MADNTIVIAGGGASGTLLAHALVQAGSRVVVVEPRGRLGAGVAYSTNYSSHVLNVPAARMSAFADDPHHFMRWLRDTYPNRFSPLSFVPRQIYGEYLTAIAREARNAAGERFTHVRSSAAAVTIDDGVFVECSDGSTVRGAALVIASGNSDPAPWPGLRLHGESAQRCFASAWEPAALFPEDRNENVVLLGTGLTAVDAVLGLRDNGHTGKIFMVSRRGLLPHEHRLLDAPPDAARSELSGSTLIALSRELTRASKNSHRSWRTQFDDLRSSTNALWQSLDVSEQRTFLRHALPYWNVHRHRMAPDVVKRLAALAACGDLEIVAGRTGPIAAHADGLRLTVIERRSGSRRELSAGRVINCSGPVHDYTRLQNPLVKSLLAQGLIAPHPAGVGIRVAPTGALVDAAGETSARLFAIGPVRFGTLIETTAIPEIREQAAELARYLLDAVAAA